MNEVVKKAIDLCGSQEALAHACGVSQAAVSLWLRGGGISVKYIPLIVKATNGEVKVHDICPELAPFFIKDQ